MKHNPLFVQGSLQSIDEFAARLVQKVKYSLAPALLALLLLLFGWSYVGSTALAMVICYWVLIGLVFAELIRAKHRAVETILGVSQVTRHW